MISAGKLQSKLNKMKIKRLDCPKFVKKLYSSYLKNLPISESAGINNLRVALNASRRDEVNSVKAKFHSDGWYLVNGVVRYEYNKEAWEPVDQEYAIKAFNIRLKQLLHGDVNILSKEESNAIQTLIKTGLASDKQIQLFQRDKYQRLIKSTKHRTRVT